MRYFLILIIFSFLSCEYHERDNPSDPGAGKNYDPTYVPKSSSSIRSSSSAKAKSSSAVVSLLSSSSSYGVISSSSRSSSSSSAVMVSSSSAVVYSSSSKLSSSSYVMISSSSVVASSSSKLSSSSSVAVSSSSVVVVASSSSKLSSSSSVAVSSSSTVVVSSSSKLSSSSSVDLCAGFVNGTVREHYGKSKAQFCDSRDGKKYVYVEIGTQTWMAENLNYNISGSKCGIGGTAGTIGTLSDANTTNCDTYGRLYNWATAMAIASTYNSTLYSTVAKHKGICPSGWHIPSYAEYVTLIQFFDPSCSLKDNSYSCYDLGYKLKANRGWDGGYNGTDTHSFTSLPGGWGYEGDLDFDDIYYPEGYSGNVGDNGFWWSASEDNLYQNPYHLNITTSSWARFSSGISKLYLISVRCIQD